MSEKLTPDELGTRCTHCRGIGKISEYDEGCRHCGGNGIEPLLTSKNRTLTLEFSRANNECQFKLWPDGRLEVFTNADQWPTLSPAEVDELRQFLNTGAFGHETKPDPLLGFVYATCTLGPGVPPKVTIGYSTAEEAQRVHGWLHENRHCEHQWEDGWCGKCGKCGKEGARNAVNGRPHVYP